ncbi:hypothetical protein LTS18_001359, partial [Coniosporium uncinatum]
GTRRTMRVQRLMSRIRVMLGVHHRKGRVGRGRRFGVRIGARRVGGVESTNSGLGAVGRTAVVVVEEVVEEGVRVGAGWIRSLI